MSLPVPVRVKNFVDYVLQDIDCPKNQIKRDIILLSLISIIVKTIIALITIGIFHSFIDRYDLTLYLVYTGKLFQGTIPYLNFPVEYPQLFFIPAIISIIPAYIFHNTGAFYLTFQGLMVVFDLFIGILVYLIALKFYRRSLAWISGLMYATAFGAAYFVFTKYDAFATFVLMLSLFLFIYRQETGAYLAGVAGFFVKWFPGIVIPYYIIYDLKNGVTQSSIKRNISLVIVFAFVIILPFLLLNLKGFFTSYSTHISRIPQASSLVYFCDFTFYHLFGVTPVYQFSFFVCIGLELILLYLFYNRDSVSEKILLLFITLALFVFVITNPVFSPQYLLWLTPLFALFLAASIYERILFYAVQMMLYLEFPIFFNNLWANSKFIIYGSSPFLSPTYTFFTLKFCILFIVLYCIIRQIINNDANNGVIKKSE